MLLRLNVAEYIGKNGKAVPLQAWSGSEDSTKLRFSDYMTAAQDGGKVVSLTHRLPLPPGNAPGTHFCYRLSRPQGHSAIGKILYQWKFPMKPSGIEPATFRFVAQQLNHCASAVPTVVYTTVSNSITPDRCFPTRIPRKISQVLREKSWNK